MKKALIGLVCLLGLVSCNKDDKKEEGLEGYWSLARTESVITKDGKTLKTSTEDIDPMGQPSVSSLRLAVTKKDENTYVFQSFEWDVYKEAWYSDYNEEFVLDGDVLRSEEKELKIISLSSGYFVVEGSEVLDIPTYVGATETTTMKFIRVEKW